MPVEVVEIALYVIVGVALQAVVRFAPLRDPTPWRERAWDGFAVANAMVFGGLFALAIAEGLRALPKPEVVAALHLQVKTWPRWLLVALNVMLSDFIDYGLHRGLHGRALWSHHAWHHAPRSLNWAAGLRGAPLHILLLSLAFPLTTYLFPIPSGRLSVYGVMLLYVVTQHIAHTNLRLPGSRWIELVFVTPRYHFVHHSRDLTLSNKNFGFVLTWWDRLFGTYHDPADVPADAPLGVEGVSSSLPLWLGLPRGLAGNDE